MPTKLDHKHKQLPYDAPYAYFENFDDKLKARIEAANTGPTRVWWMQPRWQIATAAVLLFSGAWFFNGQQTKPLTLAEISPEEKVDYLYTHTDTYFTLLAGEEELELSMENIWLNKAEAESYLESENLEILITEL